MYQVDYHLFNDLDIGGSEVFDTLPRAQRRVNALKSRGCDVWLWKIDGYYDNGQARLQRVEG